MHRSPLQIGYLVTACLLLLVFLTLTWQLSPSDMPAPIGAFSEQIEILSNATAKPVDALQTPMNGSWIFKGPLAQDKVIVMGKIKKENADWVGHTFPDWQHAIYHMDEPDYILHPPKNAGNEAMAYLTFLIDHYYNLPEIMVFIHSHMVDPVTNQHTDTANHSNVHSIQGLKLDHLRKQGYVNLRCQWGQWGCPAAIKPFREKKLSDVEANFAGAYQYMFQVPYEKVPETVATPCCSQFAITRQQALRRPIEFFIRARQWILETPMAASQSGRIMEYMWHMYFGKDSVWCPTLTQCYCQQFDWKLIGADQYCQASP